MHAYSNGPDATHCALVGILCFNVPGVSLNCSSVFPNVLLWPAEFINLH